MPPLATFQEEARAQSLRLYLYCTLIFASLRSATSSSRPCWCRARCTSGSGTAGEDKSLVIVVSSTCPPPFFVSYSSFAYSTARVYDSLTRSSATRVTRLVLVVLNAAVFCTPLFWGARELRSKAIASPFDPSRRSLSRAPPCHELRVPLGGADATLLPQRGRCPPCGAGRVVVRMARTVVSVICTCCFARAPSSSSSRSSSSGRPSSYTSSSPRSSPPPCSTPSPRKAARRFPRAFFGSASASSSSGAGEYSALKQQTYPADHGVEEIVIRVADGARPVAHATTRGRQPGVGSS